MLLAIAADRFITFRSWLNGSSQDGIPNAGIEATFLADFRHPNAGNVTAYCKLYAGAGGASRGLINEITGYAIAMHYGLPQPTPAFLAEIPLKHLPTSGLSKQHQWVKTAAAKYPTYPVWCTADAHSDTPMHHFGRDAHEAIRADLAKWPDLHKTAAFDHIIANVDRNLRNLLRAGPSKYLLIDHGQIAVEGHWRKADLNPERTFQNKLLSFMHRRHVSREAANAMVFAAQEWEGIGLPDEALNPWWDRLLSAEDRQQFDKFLRSRAKLAAKVFCDRYNVI